MSEKTLVERLDEQRVRIWNNDGELRIARALLHEASIALTQAQARCAELEKAISHILWIKDCGVDGTDEMGVFRNWPETERDKMYEIAKAALKG